MEAIMAERGTRRAESEAGEREPRLTLRADGSLEVTRDGAAWLVTARLCFPWSAPARHVSLRDADDEEVALVDDPARLDAASRRALEGALATAGFALAVTRVEAIVEEVEIRVWQVVTRHGPRRFQTRLDEWPRPLPDGTQLVRDVAGDLYVLPAPAALDAASRRLLWAFVD